MREGSRAAADAWVTGALATFAVSFALGGRAPVYAGVGLVLGGVILRLSRSDRYLVRRGLFLMLCLVVLFAAVFAAAIGSR